MVINKLFNEDVPEEVKVDNKREKNSSYKERYLFSGVVFAMESISQEVKERLPF